MSKDKKRVNKLADLDQTDGRIIEKDINSTKLEVLLGANGLGKYGTLSKDDYIKQLNSFNIAELRNHAIYAGLIPITDISRLKKQLLIEFDKYTIAFTSPTKFTTRIPSKEKQKIGLDI